MTSHTMIFIPFLLSVSVTIISGGTHGDFKRLHQVLTTDYIKDLRPTFNSSMPTNIKVRFFLLSLNEFEEKMSKLSIVGAFALRWHDFQLEWNPGDYGNITRIFLPQNSVWKPDLLLINPFQKISPLGFSDMKLYAIHNGQVFWSPPDVFEVTCQADVTFYPFDEQTCSLYFGVYMHTELEVVLDLPASGINLRHYTTNSLWHLKHTSMTQDDPSSMNLILVLQRRSMYQVINTILPFCVLGLLNIMVFLLPAESGERVGFSVTILLAIAVFMTIVADTLPGTSEPSFPRLCYLLTAELVINMLVTVLTILVLRLHHKPEHQTIPAWMEYVKIKLLCWYTKGNSKYAVKDNNVENGLHINSSNVQGSCKNGMGSENGSERNIANDLDCNVKTKRDHIVMDIKTSWQTVAKFLDIFLFVIFLLLFGSTKLAAYFVFS